MSLKLPADRKSGDHAKEKPPKSKIMSRRKFIAANWKMSMSISEAKGFVADFRTGAANIMHCDLLLCPPFLSLSTVARMVDRTNIAVGAQDLFWEDEGAYTGEVSARMIIETGATYVIVGHSERRHVMGETNSVVAKKLEAALAGDLIPIFCVGEKIEHRESGDAEKFVDEQLTTVFAGRSSDDISRILVAYEPVWAIGTGKTATPEDAETMHRFIRSRVEAMVDGDAAARLRILYGGSVKPDNASDLLAREEIDGALVGGASLKVESFLQIAQASAANS